MKAIVRQNPRHYNKRDLLPACTIIEDYRPVWVNHFLKAIVFTYNNRRYCVWAEDVTFIN